MGRMCFEVVFWPDLHGHVFSGVIFSLWWHIFQGCGQVKDLYRVVSTAWKFGTQFLVLQNLFQILGMSLMRNNEFFVFYSTWLYVCFTWVLYSIVCVFGQTHPNIDKKLFLAESQIGLKNPDKPFPLNQDVGVLKWRLQTQDEALIPLSSESCVPRCDLNDLNIGREVWVLYHSCLFLGVVYKFCLRLWKLVFFLFFWS